jgi:hypothetical protein
MKTIKELKQLLKPIKEKNYILKDYSFNDYDIKNIIENNLNKHKGLIFSKYNLLKLKLDRLENFSIFKKDKSLKDFAEIEKEIKNYFLSKTETDKIKELIKDINLNLSFNNYDLSKKPLKNIFAQLQKEFKKEIVFYNSIGYSAKDSTENTLNKIVNLFNLVLKTNININLNDLDYKTDLKTIETTINDSQNIFKCRLFYNSKMKIKFLNSEYHNKISQLFLNDSFSRFKKVVYVKIEDYKTYKKLFDYKYISIGLLNDKIVLSVDLNTKDIQTLKDNNILYKIYEDSTDNYYNKDYKKIAGFYNTDDYNIEDIKKSVVISNITEEQRIQILNVVDDFINLKN